MATPASWHLLPIDLIEHQIAQTDLLLAMYPDEEVTIEKQSQELLETFRTCVEQQTTSSLAPPQTQPSVSISLHLTISDTKRLECDIEIPFSHAADETPEECAKTRFRIRQPIWMTRASATAINAQMRDHDDLFSMIDAATQSAAQHLEQHEETLKSEQKTNSSEGTPTTGPLVRAWFYFPSISTRSKRDDLIIHAPSYSLTGFLFAGKPGLLCLEGASPDIDAYMKFIKTESWGDIPAHHKKVSERYREKDGVQRAFDGMEEITDSVGERRGARANRGDMGAVEEWLREKGLGDALAKVLM